MIQRTTPASANGTEQNEKKSPQPMVWSATLGHSGYHWLAARTRENKESSTTDTENATTSGPDLPALPLPNKC